MGFPPFRGAVRVIILASVAIYVVILLLLSFAPAAGNALLQLGALAPAQVFHGRVWQLVSYAFVYVDPLDFVLSLLGVYFLGWAVEERIGSSGFYGLFFGSAIISALLGVLLSLTHVVAQGVAIGSGAAANAVLMVFYLFNRGAPIMLFPLPIQIPVKWIVLFTAAIETAYLLLNHFALYYFILLLGLASGYIWYSLFLTRRTSVRVSERYFNVKNSYYRWKRRRAARKFEVYMRDHNQTVKFDEHGNYIPPDEPKKPNGGSKSGWVN
jgi:membrane associated rhomboid family serine protease